MNIKIFFVIILLIITYYFFVMKDKTPPIKHKKKLFDNSPDNNIEKFVVQDEEKEENKEEDIVDNNGYNSYSSYILGRMQKQDTKTSVKFFSTKNIKKIQKMIRNEVSKRSNGKYKLKSDQDLKDLLDIMHSIYFEHAKNLEDNPDWDVRRLNFILLRELMPDLMANIGQYYSYLEDINSGIKPLKLPINVNNAGRRTLPSFNTLWQ